MRRVAFAIVGTIAGLVGLLSFKTHSASVANPPAALCPALAERVRENVARFTTGRELLGRIDPDAGY